MKTTRISWDNRSALCWPDAIAIIMILVGQFTLKLKSDRYRHAPSEEGEWSCRDCQV